MLLKLISVLSAITMAFSSLMPSPKKEETVATPVDYDITKAEAYKAEAKENAERESEATLLNAKARADKMLETAAKNDLILFCYEGDDVRPLGEVLRSLGGREWAKDKNIAVIIGSEGGFSPNEANRVKEIGAVAVGLGKRILRTETASPFALACLVYEFEL